MLFAVVKNKLNSPKWGKLAGQTLKDSSQRPLEKAAPMARKDCATPCGQSWSAAVVLEASKHLHCCQLWELCCPCKPVAHGEAAGHLYVQRLPQLILVIQCAPRCSRLSCESLSY